MNTRDSIKLAKRIELWQQRLAVLGIGHWRMEKVVVCADEDGMPAGPALASVQVSEHYDTVTFYMNAEHVESIDERRLDETIVHEWLHVAMRDLDMLLEAVERWMPEATYEDHADAVKHEREGLVDRCSRAIVNSWYSSP